MPRWILATLLLCGGCGGTGARRGPAPPVPAPEFALTDLTGKTIRLTEFHGKIVLIDFWASWCGPCAASIPFYENLYQRTVSKGLVVLGIDEDDDATAVAPFVKEHVVSYPVLLDPRRRTFHAFDVQGLPTVFLIDREGRVVESWQSFDDATAGAVKKRIASLLENETPKN